jgi:hypothetical protein
VPGARAGRGQRAIPVRRLALQPGDIGLDQPGQLLGHVPRLDCGGDAGITWLAGRQPPMVATAHGLVEGVPADQTLGRRPLRPRNCRGARTPRLARWPCGSRFERLSMGAGHPRTSASGLSVEAAESIATPSVVPCGAPSAGPAPDHTHTEHRTTPPRSVPSAIEHDDPPHRPAARALDAGEQLHPAWLGRRRRGACGRRGRYAAYRFGACYGSATTPDNA